ncbi:hypothetical protein TNCV_4333001 [Trichonephila clavipes]|nr:hypothetical protein TNCV_4333001 [Trichonephila clavipes]
MHTQLTFFKPAILSYTSLHTMSILSFLEAAVAQWSIVMSWSPVPLKICRVGKRCTSNLSRAQTSSRCWGGLFRRRGASSGVVLATRPSFKSLRVVEQCDVNIHSISPFFRHS